MGSSSSKPVSPPRVRDSVVLCDGLPRLLYPKYAASPNGRFIFAIETKFPFYFENDVRDSFDLDVIDLFLSKRIRVRIGEFFNFGCFTGIYALDDRTVIIVDYETTCNTLRQRLIRVDMSKSSAECTFYRGYSIHGLSVPFLISILHLPAKTVVGNNWAVTVIPNLDHDNCLWSVRNISFRQKGFIYPANPLAPWSALEITDICDEANEHVRHLYPPGEDGDAKISTLNAPFFLPSGELAFFVDPFDQTGCVDPMTILIMDPIWGGARIEEATSSAHFPLVDEKPFWARWTQANDQEIVLLYKLKRSPRYWKFIAIVGTAFFWPLNKLTDLCRRRNWEKLQMVFTFFNLIVAAFRWNLLLEKEETKCAILDTNTLHWTEMEGTWKGGCMSEKIIPLREDFIIASETRDAGPSRVIGREPAEKKTMEQFRLIGQPNRMSSLARLSSLSVQRNGRVPAEILEQIAARML